MGETMTDERLAMIGRLHRGSVPGSIGETMHDIAAELLAAREALRVGHADGTHGRADLVYARGYRAGREETERCDAEALRAADALAAAVSSRSCGPSGECQLCGGGDIFSERDHEPECPLALYRAARGAR